MKNFGKLYLLNWFGIASKQLFSDHLIHHQSQSKHKTRSQDIGTNFEAGESKCNGQRTRGETKQVTSLVGAYFVRIEKYTTKKDSP